MIDFHTLERAEERGTNEKEIIDVINTGFSIPAKYGCLGKAKNYEFHQERHGSPMNKKELKYSTRLRKM